MEFQPPTWVTAGIKESKWSQVPKGGHPRRKAENYQPTPGASICLRVEFLQEWRSRKKIEHPVAQEGDSYSLTILAASAHNTPSFPNPFPNREDISPAEHLCFGNPFLSRFALKIPLGFAGQSSSKPRRKSDFPDFLGATLQVQSSSGGTFPYDHPLPWNGGAGGRVGIFPGVKDRASSTHSRTIWVPAVGSRLL